MNKYLVRQDKKTTDRTVLLVVDEENVVDVKEMFSNQNFEQYDYYWCDFSNFKSEKIRFNETTFCNLLRLRNNNYSNCFAVLLQEKDEQEEWTLHETIDEVVERWKFLETTSLKYNKEYAISVHSFPLSGLEKVDFEMYYLEDWDNCLFSTTDNTYCIVDSKNLVRGGAY